MPNWRHY